MAEFLDQASREQDEESEANPSRLLFWSCLVRVGSFRCPPDHPQFADQAPLRSHLMAFPRSSVWVAPSGREPFIAEPTHAVFYNAGQTCRRRPIGAEGDRSDWFGLAPGVLREAFAELSAPAADAAEVGFSAAQAQAHGHLYYRQRLVFEYVRRHQDTDVLAVEETVIAILRALIGRSRVPADRSSQRRRRELAANAMACLSLRSTRRDSLADVARALECSVFHLCRVFRGQTGSTLHQYRRRLRVRRALERVIEGDEDLLTLGMSLGFSGHSHFTASFKREFGIVPSMLRQRSRSELRRLLEDSRRRE